MQENLQYVSIKAKKDSMISVFTTLKGNAYACSTFLIEDLTGNGRSFPIRLGHNIIQLTLWGFFYAARWHHVKSLFSITKRNKSKNILDTKAASLYVRLLEGEVLLGRHLDDRMAYSFAKKSSVTQDLLYKRFIQ